MLISDGGCHPGANKKIAGNFLWLMRAVNACGECGANVALGQLTPIR